MRDFFATSTPKLATIKNEKIKMKNHTIHIPSMRGRLIAVFVLGFAFLFGIIFGSRMQSDVFLKAGLTLLGIGACIVISAAAYLIVQQLRWMKNAEKTSDAIEAERNRLQIVLSCMGEGLIVVDKNYRITMFNDRAGALLRLPPSDAVGKPIHAVFPVFHEKTTTHCKTKQLLKNTLHEVNMMTIKLTDNYWCKNNFGKIFPLAFTAVSLWEGNDITGSVLLFRDATEEKEIDQAKDEFVSLASHQLRTPLSTINWYAEMLLDQDAGAITPKQKDFLLEISDANKRMTELVGALLNVSRLDLGTFVIDPKPADIVALIKEVLHDLKSLTEKNKISVSEQYDTTPTVNIDKDLMRIVFQNLISNAIKYSQKGGSVAVEVCLSRATQRGKKQLSISIRDNGYGIPKTEQKKIFTKLFRADNIKAKITDGNGLGLYIVKSIITHAGGTISFTSEENKGTNFFITLPCDGIQSRADKKNYTVL